MKFKHASPQNRKYVLGKNLEVGQKVWFRSPGRHYDFLGEVLETNIKILPHSETPDCYFGAMWGRWPEWKYLLAE